jgi:hypothetical protein
VVYFFAVLQGIGSFHQVNHILGIIFYLYIAFMAIYDFRDDLLQQRRKVRVVVVVFISVYSCFLSLLELFDDSLRASSLFGVINSVTILVLIFLFSTFLAKTKNACEQSTKILPNIALQASVSDSIPII